MKRLLSFLILIPFFWACGSKGKADPPGPMRVPVSVKAVHRGDVPVTLNGLGTVTPFYSVTLRTRVDGQLMRVAVTEGQRVNKGDLLAEIDSRSYQVQLEQAQGQLIRDQAQLQNARIDLERYQTLISEDAAPQQQLDTQKATVAGLEGALKVDQGAIDNARLLLSYCSITSPIDGRVGLRLVDPGNMVHANDANGLLIITQVEPIAVVFSLPENQLQSVLKKLNAREKLQVDALDRDGINKLATGSLLTADNQIDPTTGTVKMKALFENKDAALFPNQFVNARLQLELLKHQLLVPASAIQHGPQGSFVFVIDSEKKAHVRPVTTGVPAGNEVVIKTGANEGEQVVSDGADKLKEGSAVEVR